MASRVRLKPLPVAGVLVACILCYALVLHPLLPRGYLAYSTRPLWDRSEAPTQVIPHYWAHDLAPDQQCAVHGWDKRTEKPQVWDAVRGLFRLLLFRVHSHPPLSLPQTIFSTELDLLLVRLHELSPVVSRFFLVESDRTFTGHPKPRLLESALATDARLEPYLAQITYRPFTGAPLAPGESPFEQEIALRRAMTDLLRREYPAATSREPAPVLVFSDVDEIPSRKTVELLQACDFGSPLHLGMKSYLYSFEWEEGGETSSWRPTAVEWPLRGKGADEFYR